MWNTRVARVLKNSSAKTASEAGEGIKRVFSRAAAKPPHEKILQKSFLIAPGEGNSVNKKDVYFFNTELRARF